MYFHTKNLKRVDEINQDLNQDFKFQPWFSILLQPQLIDSA